MKQLLCFLIASSLFTATAGDKYALLIGIKSYQAPPGYVAPSGGRSFSADLYGSVNDVKLMYSIITTRFQFPASNIDTLLEQRATRDAIINAFDQLLAKSKSGDIVFIFYAGHGSRVKNSLSFERDKMDQTIVPADTWKEGVHDIRDKELSSWFNRFLDKGVKLTIIFDCCHSGSISRGPDPIRLSTRFIKAQDYDAKDATQPQIPEERPGDNFLIISSAQSDQLSGEMYDIQGTETIPHGIFTYSLSQAINQLSANSSAQTIFAAIRAVIKSRSETQEPVIGGSIERQQQTLFGMEKGTVPEYALIGVTQVLDDNKVKLQGGYGIGLRKKNELCYFGNGTDTLFKLRIDSVTGIAESIATVVKGKIAALEPGLLFRVTNWASGGDALLRIYIPPSNFTDEDIRRFTETATTLKNAGVAKWQAGYTKGAADPYTTVYWRNGKCFVKKDKEEAKELIAFTVDAVTAYCVRDSTLYVELPVSKNNTEQYRKRLQQNKQLAIVTAEQTSQFVLFGRLGDHSLPAYGLRKKSFIAADSLEALPIQTDCFELPAPGAEKNIADSLLDRATKLSKIIGWLNLQSPEGSTSNCGYHLEIYNHTTKTNSTGGSYKIGETISLKLVADADLLAHPERYPKCYYIYVFIVDQAGSMFLYYPGREGNVTNRLPKCPVDASVAMPNDVPNVNEVPLYKPYKVGAPSGTDYFFLLATEEPIQDPYGIFNQKGIMNGLSTRNNAHPLNELLEMGNGNSRNATTTKANWSLQKISFKCIY